MSAPPLPRPRPPLTGLPPVFGDLELSKPGAWYAFTVPGKPPWKKRGRIARRGKQLGMRKHDDTVACYERVQAAAYAAGVRVTDLPVQLLVTAVWPCPNPYTERTVKRLGRRPSAWKPTSPDAKNILAGFEDALEGIAWTVDSRIIYSAAQKLYAAQGQPTFSSVFVQRPGYHEGGGADLGLAWNLPVRYALALGMEVNGA